ncbi:radical SAM protein [Bdellovibrionota bacterium FG-2]
MQSFEHLSLHPVTQNKILAIDTFNDRVEILDRNALEKILSSTSQEAAHWSWSAEKLARLKIKYDQRVQQERRSRPASFILCPTFECNMRCTYCYQQYDPTLNRGLISDEKLNKFFAFVDERISAIRSETPERPITIELFGGEPFQIVNREIIQKVFVFARARRASLVATSNGLDLEKFADLLATYRGYIARIGTTLDGGPEFHNRRRIARGERDSFSKISSNVDLLIKLGIGVTVSMNVDPSNIEELPKLLDHARERGWADNPLVRLEIGRVDDRNYDSKYRSYFMEAELYHQLLELQRVQPFPSNIKYAFLKASLPILKHFGLTFNQLEGGRTLQHYCWSSSPIDEVHYVDAQLNTYRCTFSVGKKQYRTGNLATQIDNSAWTSHNLFKYEECQACPLGGSCSGGCVLSFQRDRTRQCREELENFRYLVSNVIVPLVRERIGE